MLDVGITKVEVFLKFDGGIRKVEVVTEGECEVFRRRKEELGRMKWSPKAREKCFDVGSRI